MHLIELVKKLLYAIIKGGMLSNLKYWNIEWKVLKYTHSVQWGCESMNTGKITNYKPKDFAELVCVSVKTLQCWDREGILKSNRSPTNRRYYTYD